MVLRGEVVRFEILLRPSSNIVVAVLCTGSAAVLLVFGGLLTFPDLTAFAMGVAEVSFSLVSSGRDSFR